MVTVPGSLRVETRKAEPWAASGIIPVDELGPARNTLQSSPGPRLSLARVGLRTGYWSRTAERTIVPSGSEGGVLNSTVMRLVGSITQWPAASIRPFSINHAVQPGGSRRPMRGSLEGG